MPRVELGVTGLIGMTFFGLIYEWTHFLVHTSYRPRSRWFRRLWRNHRLHHFKNENYWFGVSMLGADYLLGTHPGKGDVETSSTCLTLGYEETLASESVGPI